MMYSEVFRELLKRIEDGEYGSEWQKLLKDNPYAAVNAERNVYICRECGHWETGQDITLYVPNNPEAINGIKALEEEYVPWDLKEEYHVLKRHYHKCSKCGRRMHKATEEEMLHLPCPKCGTQNETDGNIMWD